MPTTRTRKTTAAKPAAKKTTARKTAATKPTTTVDLRKPLPRRTNAGIRGEFITEPQIDAAHALATAGLRLPIRAWTTNPDGTATTHYRTGAHLHHNPDSDTPLTAITPCARGAHHTHPVRTTHDLAHATTEAINCRTDHGGPNPWPEAVHLQPLTPALTPADLPAPRHDAETTYHIDIRALTADTETPKEHPNG